MDQARFHLLNNTFILHPHKAMYWKEKDILIISDPHFSKSAHFRKNGIAVPAAVDQNNYKVLDELLNIFQPSRLLILGDLFHSDYNEEMQNFRAWRKKNDSLEIRLTLGNHDRLDRVFYDSLGIEAEDQFLTGPFLFTHDPVECDNIASAYIIHGHVHPSIRIRGKGRQALSLPCFLFSKTYAILPSFGNFTGSHQISQKKGDRVFAVPESQIIEIPLK